MGSSCSGHSDVKQSRRIQPIDAGFGAGKAFMKRELKELAGKKKTKANLKAWKNMFGEYIMDYNRADLSFRRNPEKFRKLCAKGIPTKYRWEVWMALLEVNDLLSEDRYFQYLDEVGEIDEENDQTMRQIILDVNRSFTWHPYFDKNVNKEGLIKLKRCLEAYSAYNPKIGYTQGMNYIMGFLLLISGGKEVEAFWFFVSLTEGRSGTFYPGIEQLYTEGFPLYYQYVEVFDEMFEEEIPDLKAYFDSLDFRGPIWLQKWFITMFLYSFPLAYCVRIWDNIFSEGPIFIFKMILSVISDLKSELLKCDLEQLNSIISGFNSGKNCNTMEKNASMLSSVERLIESARSISVTLPDLNTTKSEIEE
ncbi:unnamed protein product [Moneuplotes crassus]|uniref:Rab-GAP TBC domain-containing protein n=1 Tax=Euplotes crassus TaxID=5936 RepID=A0AAD1XG08_EUPCR|nr:unnamed protein product [Moneuplotes crassus]